MPLAVTEHINGARRDWGVGRDCGDEMLNSLVTSVTKPNCENEHYGKKSGTGYSKRDGKYRGIIVFYEKVLWVREL